MILKMDSVLIQIGHNFKFVCWDLLLCSQTILGPKTVNGGQNQPHIII